MRIARVRRVAAVTTVLTLTLTGCSTGSTPRSDGDMATGPTVAAAEQFPVTIKHVYGETTIEAAPARVATVSWVNADVSLALGVVPVGMPSDEWGGNEQASTPWKDAALEQAGAGIGSGAAPVQYSEADGINYDEIAKLTPDVILAAYSGITEEEYEKLSKIAKVIAYPEVAYGTPWQDSTRMIGEALGRSDQAEELIESTEQTVADKVSEYPQLQGKTFIYGNLEPAKGAGVNIYTEVDNRSRFLSLIGMDEAPIVSENAKEGDFYIEWSPERANELVADIFVTWVPEARTVAQIKKDPLLSQIPAVKNDTLVADSDNTLTLAISASNPLSLPWALDEFLPQLAAAADKVA